MKEDKYEKRIKSEQQCMRRITNNDLICRDCVNRFDDSERAGNTSFCSAYPRRFKPNEVINGGDCRYYIKEEQ